ncbi:hypothetical protein C7H19_24625 [Aphanothece hegewaldii CCALA 016]|uniref:Transposase n=2 Tax=Aphanothece TaxID=1121 RepID=A0A2T1LQJ4_9CHRO|nr:hypothetical protein C7H19_24625 [Aphanothece hegewaldii CCALA 016]
MGIEAMFKDCKSGGYNLESTQASIERATRLVLLIAIAYTFSTLKGQSIRHKKQQEYICRLRKIKQTLTKNSHFWRLFVWRCLDHFSNIYEGLRREINGT